VREPFNIWGYLMNPMVLIMLVTVVMAVMMQRMMKDLTPEQMKEMQEQMGDQGDPQSMLKNLFSGGASKKEAEADD
jgi:hypothetical protein